jgi:CAAX prenyl protease-like protein
MSLPAVDRFATDGTDLTGTAYQRWWDFLSFSIGYTLITLVIWTTNPVQRWLYWTTLAWVLLVTVVSFEGRKAMGLQISTFWKSSWVIGIALLFGACTITLAGRLHTLHHPQGFIPFIQRFWGYSIWAFLQQFLLQDFFLLRLIRILPDKRHAVIVGAALFSVAHLPNPILIVTTLLWGFIACSLFLRYRNLYSLAVAHAVLGICLAISLPGQIIHNMRVGAAYFAYRPPVRLHHHHIHLSHNDHIASTKVWVVADDPTRRFAHQALP